MKVTFDLRQLDMFGDEIIGLTPEGQVLKAKRRRKPKQQKPVQLELFEDDDAADQNDQA